MIALNEFKKRREAVMHALPADAVAIIPGACEQTRNNDVHYPFRQQSDFLYLTGFNEPDAVLVMTGGHLGQTILFCQPYSVMTEIWTGPLLGPERAVQALAVDLAFPMQDFNYQLSLLMMGKSKVYYPFLQSGHWEKPLFQAWKAARGQRREDKCLDSAFIDITPMLSECRLFKSPAEIACMQHAVDVSVDAHTELMRNIQSCHFEYQALAIFQYELAKKGCTEVAYPSIVASGTNACILHYTQSSRKWNDGDLLLIDAGAEWQGYAADITRTYPVNGHWSFEQQALYELVLNAQMQAISIIKPGILWTDMQQIIVEVLTQGLVDLGILTGSVSGLIEKQAYKDFYMHNSGHWLGLDVHDAGAYIQQKAPRTLAPNMALTVEPGLYLSPRLTQVDKRWRGIGIRIEDDILVTEDGHRILSAKLPKTIEDIKAVS
jgi:Xaa-Pro aminopeptidase